LINSKFALLPIVLLLAACGGGGGSSSTPAANVSYPLLQAMQYALAHGLQNTLPASGTAVSNNVSYPVSGSLTLTSSTGSNTTFNNIANSIQTVDTVSGNLIINSINVPFNSTGTSYYNSNYQPFGDVTSGRYCVSSSPGSYPTTATAGMTGSLTTYNCYSDSTKTTLVGTNVDSYVTTANANGNLNLQVLTHMYDATNVQIATGSTTYQISPSGIPTLTGLQMLEVSNGITISLVLGN
jgi:hypothetical protein